MSRGIDGTAHVSEDKQSPQSREFTPCKEAFLAK
jgi:hypothetical protein